MKPDPRHWADDADSGNSSVMRAAAEWRARQDAGLTPVEQDEFLRWLGEDPRHADLFDEMESTWSLLDRAREIPPTALGLPVSSSAGPANAARPARRGRRRWLPVSLAAAAAVAFVAWVWQRPENGMAQFTESTTIEAEIFKRVNLPDGSVVRLRAATAIAVRYGQGERQVRLLRGEAHFTVAKDPARPFVVEANGVGIRAVGTAFSVSTRAEAIEVLVTEGKVRVESALAGAPRMTLLPKVVTGEEPVLSAGEKAVVPRPIPLASAATAAVERLPAGDIESAVSWQKRTLAFEAAPLAEIVAEFNRYNRHQLVVADSALGGRRFGGSFRADDPDGFVALLSAASDVTVEKRANQTVIRSRR